MKKWIGKLCNKEVISYIFWGITTTVINIVLYTLLGYIMDYKIANFVSIIATKVYAYFVNKLFVFRSSCAGWKELLHEITAYVLSRGFTGLVDFFGVIVLVEGFLVNQSLAKYIVVIIVMALNYILGRKAVFVRRGKNDGR